MKKTLSIVMAQLNFIVGDIEYNTERMLQVIAEQHAFQPDLILFSELALTGYPPEDLLLRGELYTRCDSALQRLCSASLEYHCAILVGHPHKEGACCYNALSVFSEGKLLHRYFKQQLPNYGVFDEQRYFTAGSQTSVVELAGYKLGLLICEDIWFDHPIDQLQQHGAEIILSINASPYSYQKPHIRHQLLLSHCARVKLPLVYLNQVGGQDELVFDGDSKVLDAQGRITHQLVSFKEQVVLAQFIDQTPQLMLEPAKNQAVIANIYDALVLSVRDYVRKNGFKQVILGLSGGIDSALTLAIAVDALGSEQVQAVMMPSRYTSKESLEDAEQQAIQQNIKLQSLSIQPLVEIALQQLGLKIETAKGNITQENLQARTRGVILMALSNSSGALVLTTGNKSEVAVGYTTLYGDMVGGFAVLKDIYKTLVYQLAEYRNQCSAVIPARVLTKAPSAELAPEQRDQDSLPPYEVLDAILKGYIEQACSVNDLVEQGYDEQTVRKIIRLVDMNEYKRRQAAIGPKMTQCSFGKERRYPITSGFGHKNWPSM